MSYTFILTKCYRVAAKKAHIFLKRGKKLVREVFPYHFPLAFLLLAGAFHRFIRGTAFIRGCRRPQDEKHPAED
jgi:hypothetical protein